MERVIARLDRIMEEQEFESMDEANAFLETYLSGGSASLEDVPAPSTPLERAKELIYDAFDTDDPQRRVELAEEALEISEDCSDAYVILAEESAEDAEVARDLYELGVRAGERALGEEFFTEEVGNFWGILETRPYMRAREGLTRGLWRFRTEGGSKRATTELQEATDANPYVPLNLLGRKNLLAQGLPELIGFGDESEVVSYFAGAMTEWLKTPGAVEWLRENTDERSLSQLEQE
jgi:ST7 protein